MLLDTGPLVALLDPRDAWHGVVIPAWPGFASRCVTTEAVLTEASYLAARGQGSRVRPLEYLLAAGIPILALDVRLHAQTATLMRRYADPPMAYADATLVALADALGVDTVFTTDRRGFGTYRGARGTAFELVP